jgi:hypothetical protein
MYHETKMGRTGMRVLALAAAAIVLSAVPAMAACDLKAADAASAGTGCARAWMDANLRMNDIVAVGTHNSYKLAIDPKIFALVEKTAPKVAPTLDYGHRPLSDELNDGARAIEIDVAYDPKGGLFAHPFGPKLVGLPDDPGYAAAMSKPGFKVLHFQDIDFRSSCVTLHDCLAVLKGWSRAHPDHVPILLSFNAKDDSLPNGQGTQALKFDAAAYDALDAEIRAVLSPRDLITPDDVQGSYPTLREAVTKGGWPTLGQARGKFILALDEHAEKAALYAHNAHSLKGRPMFIGEDDLTAPDAAFIVLNEPMTDDIAGAVKQGFIVRTRADADTVEARANDTKRRDVALASGAQYVSTDYMVPDTRFGPYTARMPDGVVAACNPLTAAGKCAGVPVEAAAH